LRFGSAQPVAPTGWQRETPSLWGAAARGRSRWARRVAPEENGDNVAAVLKVQAPVGAPSCAEGMRVKQAARYESGSKLSKLPHCKWA